MKRNKKVSNVWVWSGKTKLLAQADRPASLRDPENQQGLRESQTETSTFWDKLSIRQRRQGCLLPVWPPWPSYFMRRKFPRLTSHF